MVRKMDYKQLADDLLSHLVEGWGVANTIEVLKLYGYTEDEIAELDLYED
jgi:hypothetical protein